ncbi:MAG: glycine cleavage system protein GcvH [Acidimicrobiales bacterium]
MNFPEELRYSPDHEWTRVVDARATVGITDYAQDALGDVVYLELPEVGRRVTAGESFSEIESTKSVSDIYAPVSGLVVAVNDGLADSPQRVNEDPYGDGWICVIELDNPAELDELLDSAAYQALVEAEADGGDG